MDTLKEIVIELLLKNKELEKELVSKNDSLLFWYKKHDELEKELETLKNNNNE